MKTTLTVDEIQRRLHVVPEQIPHGHRFRTSSGVVVTRYSSGSLAIQGRDTDVVEVALFSGVLERAGTTVDPTPSVVSEDAPPWDSAQVAEEDSLPAEKRACLEADARSMIREGHPAGTLHFETREELRQALDAPDLFAALHNFDVWLRDQIKHHNQHQFQPVRDELYRQLGEFLPQ